MPIKPAGVWAWALVFVMGCGLFEEERIKPVVVTEPVAGDSDDPAIWRHPEDPLKSLVLGTDKGGALFVFDLDGKVVAQRTEMGRPNGVDVEYGVALQDRMVDIAVVTDRDSGKVFVFGLPDLTPLDGGNGIGVFEGENQGQPMGVGLYKRPTDGAVFVILSRKDGPQAGYLWQYKLVAEGDWFGLEKVRAFGLWSGMGEIEAVAVDDEMGFVYYSDELFGIRKYHADPDAPEAGREVAHFGTVGFVEDREGICIFPGPNGRGYLLVSDQQGNVFQVFARTGNHAHLGTVRLSTRSSDGSEVIPVGLSSQFPQGLFVAMSNDRTFHYYDWRDLARVIEK